MAGVTYTPLCVHPVSYEDFLSYNGPWWRHVCHIDTFLSFFNLWSSYYCLQLFILLKCQAAYPHLTIHGSYSLRLNWEAMGPELNYFTISLCQNLIWSNSFLASGHFHHLLITFVNSLDLYKAWQKVWPDLDSSCLTPYVKPEGTFWKKSNVEIYLQTRKNHENLPIGPVKQNYLV